MPSYSTVGELLFALNNDAQKYQEVWVLYGNSKHMCALISGKLGWIMYVNDECETGLCTENKNYQGDKSISIEYFLDNGQQDLCPAHWTIRKEEIETALILFLETGRLDSALDWQEYDR